MKRFFTLYSIVASILAVTTVSAQDVVTTKDSRVSNFEVSRANGKLTIDMDIDISTLEIGSDETFVITPVIINGSNIEKLAAIEVMGRRAYLYSQRNDAQTVTDNPFYSQRKAKRAERKAGQKQSVEYNATTNFAEWMRGGKVQLNMGSCGCDPWVEYVGTDDAGDVGQEIYNPSYICSYIAPEPEPIKVRNESHSAYINFWVDRYEILEKYKNNATELAGIIESITKVDDDEDLTITSITIEGWASPEATEQHNKVLSQNRANSLANYVSRKTGVERNLIEAIGCGEDWDGFKEMVEQSNIKDKNLILQVLSLYNSPAEREAEIKNMSAVFTELKKEILPKLRRAQLINSTDIKGKTNDEMAALINSGRLEELTNEELLYMAESVITDAKVQATVLEYAAKKFNDARAYNNLGVAYAKLGDAQKALQNIEKAAQLGLNNNELNSNLALVNLANGNVAKAQQYAAAADAKTKSMIAAAQGNYSAAASTLSGYNAAIANTMNNDLTAAKKAIAADASAKADYLRAVIAAKEGNNDVAKAALQSAIAKDPSLAKKAAKDVNLATLR